MLAATCRSFPTRRPSDVLGIDDEVVAEDFNAAAAWVLKQGDDQQAINLAKLQAALMWGGTVGGSDGGSQPTNFQNKANDFFGS